MDKLNPTWHHTSLRVKDGKKSVDFYTKNFGFTLLHKQTNGDKSTRYFLATLKKGVKCPEPGTKEAEKFLYNFEGTALSFIHFNGTENKKEEFIYNNGNIEPNRGFGHIAVSVDDVYKTCEELEKKGVQFKKKPNEGRMKGLAFAYDPDHYWIEIIKRGEKAAIEVPFNLSQTMIRIKDPKVSVPFYEKFLGLPSIREKHFESAKFSLFFLSRNKSGPKDPKSKEAYEFLTNLFHPIVELTHNHGTESKEGAAYHNGNTDPVGFQHIAFLVDDVEKAVKIMETNGIKFKEKPKEGEKGIATALDPDNYYIQLIPRGYTTN